MGKQKNPLQNKTISKLHQILFYTYFRFLEYDKNKNFSVAFMCQFGCAIAKQSGEYRQDRDCEREGYG
jgi:hypothetical protein